MTLPRSALISVEDTPYYHCVSRCVRRAFLCGVDSYSGKSYEHRRTWVEDELLRLAKVFCIDVAAYAVMSNHFHVVLHINDNQAEALSDREVIERWHCLFKGRPLSQRYLLGTLSPCEMDALSSLIEQWRERLCSISWFMRLINEKIAREANKEDQCKGRFWEGRFKSHALLDEKALAACMAYVDLNPIRAKMAKTPEHSEHTSIKQRIAHARKSTTPNDARQQTPSLMPFAGNPRKNMPDGIPFKLSDYLELVDWTGKIVREDKRGAIADTLPPILERLDINPEQWMNACTKFETRFKNFVGHESKVRKLLEKHNKTSCHGILNCQLVFS